MNIEDVKQKSTLPHTETVKALLEISDMSDEEISINMPYIRQVASSAYTHLKTAGAKRETLKKKNLKRLNDNRLQEVQGNG